ncbi:MAG: DUF547 domain-containing protein [Myxococcota bacterium]|nr:DUF547 domain-containing protein [Myxococcota bacterium]
MIWMMLAGCGQYVDAGETLVDGSVAIDVSVELPDRSEMNYATTLQHYGQSALLSAHTSWESVSVLQNDGAESAAEMRMVEYSELLNSIEARVVLADALANLAAVDPSTLASPNEQLAYWMNVYNLWVVQAILDRLSSDPAYVGVESDDFLIFTTAYIQVGEFALTPNQIEHAIIRGDDYAWENYFIDQPELLDQAQRWNADLWGGETVDARIHAGLNCASRSCPDLIAGAFRAETLDADLDALAAAFVNNPTKGAGPNGVSTLFSWYGADFEADYGSGEAFIAAHRDGGTDGVNMDSSLFYDWRLNGR